MRKYVEIYKKEIETFLRPMGIFKGKSVVNFNRETEVCNKHFIKEKMSQMCGGNINEKAFDIALDELYPYLRQNTDD